MGQTAGRGPCVEEGTIDPAKEDPILRNGCRGWWRCRHGEHGPRRRQHHVGGDRRWGVRHPDLVDGHRGCGLYALLQRGCGHEAVAGHLVRESQRIARHQRWRWLVGGEAGVDVIHGLR